jgi:hypothetical protein
VTRDGIFSSSAGAGCALIWTVHIRSRQMVHLHLLILVIIENLISGFDFIFLKFKIAGVI